MPAPDEAAQRVSERLQARLRSAVRDAGGWLSFERFMDMALYEPGLGYYSAGSVKLGTQGDFVTAPELTPLFGRVVARQCAEWLRQLSHPVILELGPGSGRLAAELTHALTAAGQPLSEYWLLETSAELRSRQQQNLAACSVPVRWLDGAPDRDFEGVIIANEVADALPVVRFAIQRDGPVPLGVAVEGELVIAPGPQDRSLSEAVAGIQADAQPLPTGYVSEYCPRLGPWLETVTRRLTRGAALLVDYGLPRSAYYHVDHRGGRLLCHYRHRAHQSPLWWPGLSDITAWVDFTALARAGRGAGLELSGFTTQANWLLSAGILEAADQPPAPAEAAALQTLLLPGEMGERFKAMLLTRGVEGSLPGRDLRGRL